MKILTFDLEIAKAIPDEGKSKREGYEYCEGWNDKAGMGISLGCAYLSWLDRFKFYDEKNIMDLIDDFALANLVTGFNIHGFDVSLLKGTLQRLGLPEKTGLSGKTYDLFLDIKRSLGNNFPKGWTMENVARTTLGEGKSGAGAEAPFIWQDGCIAQIASYVLADVRLEHKLFLHALKYGSVSNKFTDPASVELTLIQDVEKKLRQLQKK